MSEFCPLSVTNTDEQNMVKGVALPEACIECYKAAIKSCDATIFSDYQDFDRADYPEDAVAFENVSMRINVGRDVNRTTVIESGFIDPINGEVVQLEKRDFINFACRKALES